MKRPCTNAKVHKYIYVYIYLWIIYIIIYLAFHTNYADYIIKYIMKKYVLRFFNVIFCIVQLYIIENYCIQLGPNFPLYFRCLYNILLCLFIIFRTLMQKSICSPALIVSLLLSNIKSVIYDGGCSWFKARLIALILFSVWMSHLLQCRSKHVLGICILICA